VRRLHAEAVKAVAAPDVQQAASRQGLEIETSSPQELAQRISTETAMWAALIKDAGIRAE
jgi:tripartite-type tricarboxylate transporter receptor subunit TctC